jgi:trigger factor
VPQDLVLKKVGEVAVLEEAAELFVKDFYPELVDGQKADVVGRPDIRIVKLAPGNPVSFVIRATVYPQFELPKDWKKIGESVPLEAAAPATEEEVNNTLESLRKNKAEAAKSADEAAPTALPELNDEFAKSVGAFESLAQLKEQITKGIGEEKARSARDARRGKIIEKLLAEATLPVPRIFVESELDKIMGQMQEDVSRFGMSFEDYLKKINKTEEGMRDELREQAAKRAKLQLVLNKIGQEENIEADKEAVEGEMTHALEHFPEANKALVRIHIETVLRNEMVLKLLEGDTAPKVEA